ncbi:hypothetical protein [Alkalihalobacillus sp. 1P02AB]|uniref:hypothetical protein n=1 Tax=Alkalihalobacillus sp. 1P02AB TaxID=3132260 RepID=UPI0039A767B8
MRVKIILIRLMLFMLISMTACSYEESKRNRENVESTPLEHEKIDELTVGEDFQDLNKDIESPYKVHPDNTYFSEYRNYDQYWNEDLMLAVERESGEVLSILMLENNRVSKVLSGLKIGDSIDEITNFYGKSYYDFKDREQAIYIYGYVDHDNGLELAFIHNQKWITGISLSLYDKLEWK